jgi:L-ascorbate metabolism protein UlaG (beta-lactamase superfamily)
MATRVHWLGHACLLLESDGQQVLIDPFLTGNPAAARKPGDVPAHAILVSHGHGDHLGDTVAIAKRTGATVVANYEISEWLKGRLQPGDHPDGPFLTLLTYPTAHLPGRLFNGNGPE